MLGVLAAIALVVGGVQTAVVLSNGDSAAEQNRGVIGGAGMGRHNLGRTGPDVIVLRRARQALAPPQAAARTHCKGS